MAAQPGFGGVQQGREHVFVIHRLDEAEMTGGVVIAVQMQLVDLGGDAAHRLAVAVSQEKTGAAMLKIGIVLGLKMEMALQQQRRHPLRIVAIEFERQMMEIMPLLLGLYRDDLNRHLNGHLNRHGAIST